MADHDQILKQRYCPPLDESLFIVLAGDYDLENNDSRKDLEQILGDLKEQAVVEQELELTAPATNITLQHENAGQSQTASQATTTDLGEHIDSITTGLSDLHTNSEITYTDFEPELPQGLEEGSVAEKEKWLKILFPSIEPVQITETVSKCGGNVQTSIDELLNLSFINNDIDENYVPPPVLKGVDGFAEEAQSKKIKTKGHKKKGNKQIHVTNEVSDSPHPAANVWKSTAQDVDFIVSRTNLPTATVTSLYHKNNANLALTIRTLITKEAESQAAMIRENEIIHLQAAELKLDLEGFSDNSIYGALLLAQMIPSAARDLLEATTQSFEDNPKTGKLIGIAQYTPINLSEDEAPTKKKAISAVPMGDAVNLMSQAGVHSYHADRAFSQASSAYRRGKSDRLMGGAAAYYASVGHERRQRQKELMASAASAYVSQQSSSTVLDLHGVTVEHAIMLARARVESWWEGLGDRKYVVGGIGDGYKIITGVGTHSAQGIGRIGPAVSKTLINEGWRVNVQRGEIIVEGRARR